MHTWKLIGLFEQNSLPRISHELVFSNSATLAHLRPERLDHEYSGDTWRELNHWHLMSIL